MSSRFVGVEVDVLPLSMNGDTVTVKRRLNHGETTTSRARMFPPEHDRGKCVQCGGRNLRADPSTYQQELVLAYLVDWNLTDNGRPVAIRGLQRDDLNSALNLLDDDTFREIVDAVQAHVEKQEAARAEEKKLQAGAAVSSSTSPSPV